MTMVPEAAPEPGGANATRSKSRGPGPTQRLVLVGMLAALAYVTSYNPIKLNVEVKSLLVFFAGTWLGISGGLATGGLVALLQGFFDPMGPAGPALTAFLLLAFTGIGLGGGILGRVRAQRWLWINPACGVITALYFDLITCLPGPVLFGMDWRIVFVGQIPFSLVHVTSNMITFGYGIPALLEVVRRLEPRLGAKG